MKTQFRDELLKGIQNYPVLYVPHFHQKFICDEIRNVCEMLFVPNRGEVIITTIEGSHKELATLYENGKSGCDKYVDYIIDGIAQHICNVRENVDSSPICVVKGVDSTLLNDGRFVSLIHEFVEYYETKKNKPNYNYLTIVLCVPSCEMPPLSISSISCIVDIQPPREEDIRQELLQMKMSGDSLDITEYVRALQGLHLFDIRQIIRSTKNTYGKHISPIAVRWAYAEKQELVRKTGVLEVVDPDVSLEDIGGLKRLQDDIRSSAILYKNLPLLREANVPIPKGFLLLGMPGCGKSMIAKATATEFGCPLLKLDMGKLLGKYVGDSEHNLQIALDVVDSAHPCVLWIDEIEKAFAGTNNASNDGDSVMMRLMGKFLSWMQERKTAVFIMATANDVLKPELMRKGRFDEVYFVDFPTANEAEEIIRKTIKEFTKLTNGGKEALGGLFTETYFKVIAKQMTTSEIDSSHCFSGAEITSFINSLIANKLSAMLENMNKNDKASIDMRKLSITKKELNDQLVEAKKSAMINQTSKKDVQGKPSTVHSFIDKIYEFEDKYKFKHASK